VVYDVTGARVRTLVEGEVSGGKYTVEWDGRNDRGQTVGSGVYFYRLVERNFTQTKKMLLLK
jgi:flagellar hook assembly protein FlgD